MMNNEQAYRKLYTAVNKLMAAVGCHGEIEINSMDDISCEMMGALYEIDNGTPDDLAHGFVEVGTKYVGD
jgi:hypothetical protein